MGWLEEQVERDIQYKVKMENWTKVSNEEIKKGYTLVGLKKGKLQILLAKALAREDKIRKYIHTLDFISYFNTEDEYIRCQFRIEEILNEGDN